MNLSGGHVKVICSQCSYGVKVEVGGDLRHSHPADVMVAGLGGEKAKKSKIVVTTPSLLELINLCFNCQFFF